MVDNSAGLSLLLAKQDLAQREHLHNHNHNHFHNKRQATAVVTEIVATVSVVQQVDIDGNGSTYAIETLTTESSPTAAASSTNAPASQAITTPTSAESSTAVAGSQPDSSLASQSLLSRQSTTSASTTLSIPTSFPSLIISSNSTSLISTSVNSSTTCNSTLSTSRSSLTYLTSTSQSSSDDFWSSSTSSLYSPSFSTTKATSTTDTGGYAAGRTGIAPTASSTAGTGNGSSNSTAPSTPVVVGGVVGSVAGAAIILFLLMILIRWWKKRHSTLLSDSPDSGPGAIMAGGEPSQPPGGMSERRSYGVPAALASLNWHKRSSQKTDKTISSTAGSERGFYRVSGRKLPSVFQTGGDGYGGGIDTNTLSGSSFYRDSHGFYRGPGSPGPSSPSYPPAGISTQRDSGVPVMRPSPARTPVTEQSPFSDRFSTIPPPLTPPSRRPDNLGRSHPSQDGSHASRFTEEV